MERGRSPRGGLCKGQRACPRVQPGEPDAAGPRPRRQAERTRPRKDHAESRTVRQRTTGGTRQDSTGDRTGTSCGGMQLLGEYACLTMYIHLCSIESWMTALQDSIGIQGTGQNVTSMVYRSRRLRGCSAVRCSSSRTRCTQRPRSVCGDWQDRKRSIRLPGLHDP